MQKSVPEHSLNIVLDSLERTAALAGRVAEVITSGGTIAFYGGLGSGKTTFIQALAESIGCRGMVNSPTYTIINRYDGGRLPLVHVDCYRIRDEDELWNIGLAEMFTPEVLVCIEWSEKAAVILPANRLEITLEPTGRDTRNATLTLRGNTWDGADSLLQNLNKEFHNVRD